ncbi:hypothetical protein GDO78_006243 [Eleutherodactylus coqui]|uniref:Uncharacterized protein n=1 Tax=Eleutherodactylus coqui TaxID=57060 RepID=A0A8J6KJC9_ELECQ|nr:hypothetical protein GDO78_006243 [Eleutherodactylus coqui]
MHPWEMPVQTKLNVLSFVQVSMLRRKYIMSIYHSNLPLVIRRKCLHISVQIKNCSKNKFKKLINSYKADEYILLYNTCI